MSISVPLWFDDQTPGDLQRWAIAAAIVVNLHAAVVAFALSRSEPAKLGDESDVVTVELAPIDSTAEAVATDAAPATENMIESKAVPQPEKVQRDEQLKIKQPPDEAPALVTLPADKPPEKIEAALPPAPRTAEQVKGGAPSVEPSWAANLVRHLQRYKNYPAEARSHNEQGIVLLRFSLDRSGHVLTHHIVRSSGYADLDNEVIAMITRAEPLPPFPASMPQARVELTVPIRFSLR